VGKPSAIGQPTRPTQTSVVSSSIRNVVVPQRCTTVKHWTDEQRDIVYPRLSSELQ